MQNGGPSTAFDVVVTDVLPAGFTPHSATTEFGSCTIVGQTVTCTLPFVYEPPFQEFNAPILISGTVSPNAPASVTNTATGVTVEPDSSPGNNTSTITTIVGRESTVGITKATDDTELIAGGEARYTITVTNAGPSAADGAQVVDTLPPELTFIAELSDSRCALAAGGEVVCSLGTLDPLETDVVRLIASVDPSAAPGLIVNTARIRTSSPDPDPSDDIAFVVSSITQSARLSVSKVAASETVTAGGQAVFDITVTNEGPSTASDVVLTDTIPPGTTLVSVVTTPTLPCAAGSCTVGDLIPGETISATVTVAVPPSMPAGTITNVVGASTPTPVPSTQALTAVASTEVVLEADLSVTKTLATDPVVAGLPVVYDFTVTNAGPSDAINPRSSTPSRPGRAFPAA